MLSVRASSNKKVWESVTRIDFKTTKMYKKKNENNKENDSKRRRKCTSQQRNQRTKYIKLIYISKHKHQIKIKTKEIDLN